jgi:hypothetical protein
MRTSMLAAVMITLLSACATDIPDQSDNRPSAVPFGTFEAYVLSPLVVQHMEGDSGDQAAVKRIDGELRSCMTGALSRLKAIGQTDPSHGKTILIEPSIIDLKKVNVSERFWLGALAGSSAVLLRVKYTDTASSKVIAEPTFYAKASSWGGAFTVGGTDNKMLTRIVNDACGYTSRNF